MCEIANRIGPLPVSRVAMYRRAERGRALAGAIEDKHGKTEGDV